MIDFSYGDKTWETEFEPWEKSGATHSWLRVVNTAVQIV